MYIKQDWVIYFVSKIDIWFQDWKELIWFYWIDNKVVWWVKVVKWNIKFVMDTIQKHLSTKLDFFNIDEITN